MDARCAPSWILGDHAEDQIPNLLGRLASPNLPPGPGYQPPIQTKTSLVPADHCFWCDDHEGLLPTSPDAPSNYPEEPVGGVKAWPRMAPFQHDKLLA